MKKIDIYWMSNEAWYDFADDETGEPFLTDAAPTEARESFERFLAQKKELEDRYKAS